MSEVSQRARNGCSIRSVLDWYRRRITLDRFGSRFPQVPAGLAGWVVAGPGEVVDADGFRPLGAVRDLLFDLMDTARIDARERFVLCSRFGFSEYPAKQPVRLLGHRLPLVRERGGDSVSERQLRYLMASAVRALDRTIADRSLERPGENAVAAGPVSDPATAAWFCSVVPVDDQLSVFQRAVHEARVFASVTGLGDEVGVVLAEIDGYHANVAGGSWPPPMVRRGRSRARALVLIALWDLTHGGRRSGGRLVPRSIALVREPAGSTLVVGGSALGAFLAGGRSDEIVFSACEDVLALGWQDRSAARVAADLLLAAYGESVTDRLSAEAEAAVLRTSVRVRAEEGDPTAVALAVRAYVDQPLHWQTIDALQSAVRVASAYGCYEIAEELCGYTDLILEQPFSLRAGREVEVERAEYGLFTHHQRSGTLRRQLDDGAGRDVLRQAIAENDAAMREYERAAVLAQSGAPGDHSERWRFFLEIRATELRLIARGRPSGGETAVVQMRDVEAGLERATSIAKQECLTGRELMPLIKGRLAKSLADREPEHAIELLHEIHQLGWPLTRTLPAILKISQPTEQRRQAPAVLRNAVDEIAAAERAPSSSRVGDSAAGWRRARARLNSR